MGGEVNLSKVEGTLTISRSFGDFELKDLGVIVTPF